jgi:hypothetical protein
MDATRLTGARQSASMYSRTSPVAARYPAARALTSPLSGSSTTVTPAIPAATARVSSVLALLTTMISSGTRVWANSEWIAGASIRSSL